MAKVDKECRIRNTMGDFDKALNEFNNQEFSFSTLEDNLHTWWSIFRALEYLITVHVPITCPDNFIIYNTGTPCHNNHIKKGDFQFCKFLNAVRLLDTLNRVISKSIATLDYATITHRKILLV